MHILIVQENEHLGRLWANHLEREGHATHLVHSQEQAITALQTRESRVIVLDVMLRHGSAFAISDFASYRWPDARVVFVTSSTFFSDGSIFQHAQNACAYLKSDTDPEDLAKMVTYYAAT
ncbi:MAG: hypothetical protein AAGG09_12245 [Pseudomonadota bacterium]